MIFADKRPNFKCLFSISVPLIVKAPVGAGLIRALSNFAKSILQLYGGDTRLFLAEQNNIV